MSCFWDKNRIPSVEAKLNNNFIKTLIVVVLQQLLQLIAVLTFWLDVIFYKFLASNWYYEVSAVCWVIFSSFEWASNVRGIYPYEQNEICY